MITKERIIELEGAYGECVMDLLDGHTNFYPERVNDWVKENHREVWDEYQDMLEPGEEDLYSIYMFVCGDYDDEDLMDEVTYRMVNADPETIKQFEITWNKYKTGVQI